MGKKQKGLTTADAHRLARVKTIAHIRRVNELLMGFMKQLRRRGIDHDASKFSAVEIGPLTEMEKLIHAEGNAPYGSAEYKRRTALLGPMIAHHHAMNPHHPQHYVNGINGMDLFDLIEMVADWKAASERGEDSAVGLSHSIKRFAIDPQLAEILTNTFARLGWAVV